MTSTYPIRLRHIQSTNDVHIFNLKKDGKRRRHQLVLKYCLSDLFAPTCLPLIVSSTSFVKGDAGTLYAERIELCVMDIAPDANEPKLLVATTRVSGGEELET